MRILFKTMIEHFKHFKYFKYFWSIDRNCSKYTKESAVVIESKWAHVIQLTQGSFDIGALEAFQSKTLVAKGSQEQKRHQSASTRKGFLLVSV